MTAPMTLARTLALAAVAAALPALAQERPMLTIGSPNFQPLPIAVAQFQGEGGDARAAEVTEVVRGDLALSGLFEVLDPRGFLADPSEGWAAPTIRFARWTDVGAEGLVKARMRQSGAELEGELHLYEVRAGREVLVKRLRSAASDPRALGHRISDEIVRYYTREPGVFSTKLVAIRKIRGLYELVMMDADGKNPRVLLSERTILLAPSWRPDGGAVLLPTANGNAAVRAQGELEVGRPAGIAPGSPLDASFAMNVPPLPLPPGRYEWHVTVAEQIFSAFFSVRAG